MRNKHKSRRAANRDMCPLRQTGGRSALTAIIAAVIAAMAFSSLSCRGTNSEKMESINFGTVPVTVAALIYIAQDKGFFTANRLNVNIRDYATGTATTEALLRGDMDVSWVAEFPFVGRALEKEQLSIIAVVGRFNEQNLFCRKDRGIKAVADLKGKRIGIPRNTIAEFYLGRFLELNGMNIQDVSLVNVPPPQALDAVDKGDSIDGVIAWEPYASQIRGRLGDRAVALPVQNNQPGYGAVVVRNDWITGHNEVLRRFLKSLAQAEDYTSRKPAAAKAIVRKRLNYDEVYTETIWSENQLFLSLDQSLIAAMEDEARWMIHNGLTKEREVPDFVNYIYADGLRAVKPEAVTFIK